MDMDTKMRMYYHKKMSHGRSLIARIADFIVLRALMFAVLFFVFVRIWRSLTVSLLLAVLLTAAFSFAMMLLQRARAERFMRKDMQRLKKKCLLEELTLMDSGAFKQYMAKLLDVDPTVLVDTEDGFFIESGGTFIDVLHNHPTSVCGAADVLHAYRRYPAGKKRIIIALSSFNKDAKSFSSALGDTVTLIDGERVLSIAEKKSLLPDEKRAWEKAAAEMKATVVTMSNVKKTVLGRTKTRAYIVCGIIILCWPLVAGFRFYYPIIAAVCFTLAVFSYRASRKASVDGDIGIY